MPRSADKSVFPQVGVQTGNENKKDGENTKEKVSVILDGSDDSRELLGSQKKKEDGFLFVMPQSMTKTESRLKNKRSLLSPFLVFGTLMWRAATKDSNTCPHVDAVSLPLFFFFSEGSCLRVSCS